MKNMKLTWFDPWGSKSTGQEFSCINDNGVAWCVQEIKKKYDSKNLKPYLLYFLHREERQ